MIYKKIAPVVVNPVLHHPEERRIGLSGKWAFRLDPEEMGIARRWFEPAFFPDHIEVPGTWQGQGFGSQGPGEVWCLRHRERTFRATYVGSAWYARDFRVAEPWEGLRVWLNFGGVHPSAEVWVNGVRLGENHEPFVPFAFEITDVVSFGADNRVAVRVHEEAREMGLAFNWQGNWSGLYRDVELTATGEAFLERFSVYPQVDEQRLLIAAQVDGLERDGGTPQLQVTVAPVEREGDSFTAQASVSAPLVELDLALPDPYHWSPEEPNLYRVDARLVREGQVMDCLSDRTGFVKLSAEGNHFLINDEPYYMRGTGDFISSPETGSPDTDRDRWRRKLSTLRAYGYNYVRCQSYVPAPEYFDVADEIGLLVQSEMGMLGAWNRGGLMWHGAKWPLPMPDKREMLKDQWDRVVLRDVNHPSANLYCMSNELGSDTKFPRTAWRCYHDTKAIKPSALVIWTDGGYNKDLPADFINDDAKGYAFPDKQWRDVDHSQADKPLIQHEFRWFASYPDVRDMSKYTGAVRPYGAELALRVAEQRGLAHLLGQIAVNTQRLQYAEAKAKMEALRRDCTELAGICHWLATDASASPQGVLDAFYERKYADRNMWLQTNGDTVVLSSFNYDDRVLVGGEELICTFSVSDFSHPPLQAPTLTWRLVAEGTELDTGRMTYSHQPYGTTCIGEIRSDLPSVSRPKTLHLEAELTEGERRFTNAWELWLFPEQVDQPEGVAIYGNPEHSWMAGLEGRVDSFGATDFERGEPPKAVLAERLDQTLISYARQGGTVVLAATEGVVRPFRHLRYDDSECYFWHAPGGMRPFEFNHCGTIIRDHPMLGHMPHEGFADLQFFRMIGPAPAIDLGAFDLTDGEPVIRVMHTFAVCRPLAYLIECSFGEGTLIICALHLDQSLPEARYLLAQICSHAVRNLAEPMLNLSEEAIARLSRATMAL